MLNHRKAIIMSEVTRGMGTVLDDKHAIFYPYQLFKFSSVEEYIEALELGLFSSEELRIVFYTFSHGELQLQDNFDILETLAKYIKLLRHRQNPCGRWDCTICPTTCGHKQTDVSKLGENKPLNGPPALLGICRKCYSRMVENLYIESKKAKILQSLTYEQQVAVITIYGYLRDNKLRSHAAQRNVTRQRERERKKLPQRPLKKANSLPKREPKHKGHNKENAQKQKRESWHH